MHSRFPFACNVELVAIFDGFAAQSLRYPCSQ